MGTGIGHYIPLVAYFGFWVACLLSLTGRPLLGLYYIIPFIPYRTMRDHFLDYPLGGSVVSILIIAIFVGALLKGNRLPKSKLYSVWLISAIYLYVSMWLGTLLGNAPAPIWTSDPNFALWKDYMLLPLLFCAAALVVNDRKAIRTVILLSAIALFFIDRSSLMDSMSRSWQHFDENKRDGGPLGFAGANGLAAFLAQFAMFFWAFAQFVKRIKAKLMLYSLVALTVLATMYTFSRASYITLVVGVLILGLIKDRKLVIVVAVFLFTWQAIVPTAVTERVTMTKDTNGQLESSAQERVDLWTDAEEAIVNSPIFGSGFATYQLRAHHDGLRDTHNWWVKVMVETGFIGLVLAIFLFVRMFLFSVKLFRKANDPLYRGLGLGLLLTICCTALLNCFGDRWTYIEISGLLWVLLGAGARAAELEGLVAKRDEALGEGLPSESELYAIAR